MSVSPVTAADLGRVVDVLRRRREALVPHAPVFWAPAADADARHRAYLHHLLTETGARAWQTTTSVLVAVRRGAGWLVDDFHAEDWASDGVDLWNAFAAESEGAEVRFVAPTYESERSAFASSVGLALAESWWLLELPSTGGGEAGVTVALPGAEAVTVAAPPVYRPPGPMLFLTAVRDAAALTAALDRAPTVGCAGVVVSQPVGETPLAVGLRASGFRRHCDFVSGAVHPA